MIGINYQKQIDQFADKHQIEILMCKTVSEGKLTCKYVIFGMNTESKDLCRIQVTINKEAETMNFKQL